MTTPTPGEPSAPTVDLNALAGAINADHWAGHTAVRTGLEHYRAAGAKLLEAKAACGHGKWGAWVRINLRFSERRAQRYMALARTDVTSDLEDGWRRICGNDPSEDEGGRDAEGAPNDEGAPERAHSRAQVPGGPADTTPEVGADPHAGYTKLYQVRLTAETYPAFKEQLGLLRKKFGVQTDSDALCRAVGYCCRAEVANG